MSRNKEDLVDIIMLMVTGYPHLQDIVDHPTPKEIATGMIQLDTISFCQEFRDAFGGYDYDHYYGSGDFAPSRAMNHVATFAERLAQRDNWLNAAAVYRTILEEFAEHGRWLLLSA
ncbi:MAG: hypothetical protein RLP44_21515 [Aggregatilineales bacterium]